MHLDAEDFPILIDDEYKTSDVMLANMNALESDSDSVNLELRGGASEDLKSDELIADSAIVDNVVAPGGRNPNTDSLALSGVALQAEDYGGSIALPHYGFRRPSADYFNSNLMCYNFVLADISGNVNNVYLYDERDQGKGADALCSLRLRYHLGKLTQYEEAGVTPKLNMTLLDNCVGQNKSQLVMKFACLLSVLFYEKVALMFFLPGHTHMLPDRVVGQCKNSIKGLNLYTIEQIVERCNSVNGINAEWLRTDDVDRPFRVGWGTILDKYFKDLPGGYTFFYFFEFTAGFLTYRRLATTPDSDAITVQMINLSEGTKDKLMIEVFGKKSTSKVKMGDVTLPKNTGRLLSESKLKSLAEKYFSIPECFLKYYPKYDKKKKAPKACKKKPARAKRKKGNIKIEVNKKRRVGRPKNVPKIPEGVRLITTYFRSL